MDCNTTSRDIHAIPQHDPAAESWVVGSILLKPDVISDCRLSPEDFVDPICGAIYRAVADRIAKGHPIDIKLLAHDLRSHDGISPVMLAELVDAMPTAIHGPYYSDIVNERASRRWAWRIAIQMLKDSHDDHSDIVQAAQNAAAAMTKHVISRMEGRR